MAVSASIDGSTDTATFRRSGSRGAMARYCASVIFLRRLRVEDEAKVIRAAAIGKLSVHDGGQPAHLETNAVDHTQILSSALRIAANVVGPTDICLG